jgi:ParB family chromosome partitioning protein
MFKENKESTSSRPLKKPALGRGLGSLLGESNPGQFTETETKPTASAAIEKVKFQAKTVPALKQELVESPAAAQPGALAYPRVADNARIWQVPIEKLKGNPNQPRKDFDAPALKELADSIRTQGILQPIVARKREDGNFQIIAGERRWRASQLAGLKEVPVVLKEADDQNSLELALIENIQRENLNPMEEAEAFDWLLSEYQLTQQSLAEKIGKDRVSIANSLRLLKLHPDLRTYLRAGELSQGQAKVLLSLEDQEIQKRVGFEVIKQKLTVREVEKLVAKAKKEKSNIVAALSGLSSMDISTKLVDGLSQELQKILGTRVAIDYKNGKGRVKISFYSDAELDKIVDQLRGEWKK